LYTTHIYATTKHLACMHRGCNYLHRATIMCIASHSVACSSTHQAENTFESLKSGGLFGITEAKRIS